jgi:hypothetical protein
MPKDTGYYELAEDCYFIDIAQIIVKCGAQPTNYRLNETAASILRFLLQQMHKSEVASFLSKRYEVKSPEKDIQALIDQLTKMKLLTSVPAPVKEAYSSPKLKEVGQSTIVYKAVIPSASHIPKMPPERASWE